MENKEFLNIALELEKKISETILLVNDSLGKNPFDGLDKSLKIVQQRNYKQFISIKKKTKDIFMVLFGSQIKNENLIMNNLNEIDGLINKMNNVPDL
jgi:hypothetical protein